MEEVQEMECMQEMQDMVCIHVLHAIDATPR